MSLDDLYTVAPIETGPDLTRDTVRGNETWHPYFQLFVSHIKATIGDAQIGLLQTVFFFFALKTYDIWLFNNPAKRHSPSDPRKNNSSNQPNIVTCPVCYETVAGQRFAPHLEKCLNGGKRGGGPSKKASLPSSCTTNNLGIGLPYYTAPKKIDPYPLSLVIRIRLKDGGKALSRTMPSQGCDPWT